MRRKVWIAAFLVSVVLGIAYVFSLFLWTDPKTGFATAGGTGVRYLAMLLPVLLAVASGAMVPSDRRFFEKKQTGALLAAVAVSSEIYGVGLILAVLSGSQAPASSHHMTIGRALMGDLAELLLAVLLDRPQDGLCNGRWDGSALFGNVASGSSGGRIRCNGTFRPPFL